MLNIYNNFYRMTNKENEINNDKVQSKPVDSSDIKSGRVKKTKPEITIPVSPHITKPKPPQQKPPSPPRIIKANPVPQFKEPFKPIVAHRKMDPFKYSLPGEEISQHKADLREAKLKKEAQEQEKARKFKAQPLPSGSPDVSYLTKYIYSKKKFSFVYNQLFLIIGFASCFSVTYYCD